MFMSNRCGSWPVGDDVQEGEIEFRVLLPNGLLRLNMAI
jgi:hypothetical protein